jgi:hypothetical protein
LTFGDLVITITIGGSFVLTGAVAAFGGILANASAADNWALWGTFLKAGAFVTAAKFALDAIDLQGWWSVTFGTFLQWYGERHPLEDERPILVTQRHSAVQGTGAPRTEHTGTSELSYTLPNGLRISVAKLAQFLREATISGVWSRDYWCNTERNKTAPGIGFITKSRWEGIRELCGSFVPGEGTVWSTNDPLAIEEMIETIAQEAASNAKSPKVEN